MSSCWFHLLNENAGIVCRVLSLSDLRMKQKEVNKQVLRMIAQPYFLGLFFSCSLPFSQLHSRQQQRRRTRRATADVDWTRSAGTRAFLMPRRYLLEIRDKSDLFAGHICLGGVY